MPHPTTLIKLTTRCGAAAVDGCNEALLAKAAEARLLRTSRLPADTTVVPVGAENAVPSFDLHVLEHETTEPVASEWLDGRAGGRGVLPAGAC